MKLDANLIKRFCVAKSFKENDGKLNNINFEFTDRSNNFSIEKIPDFKYQNIKNKLMSAENYERK